MYGGISPAGSLFRFFFRESQQKRQSYGRSACYLRRNSTSYDCFYNDWRIISEIYGDGGKAVRACIPYVWLLRYYLKLCVMRENEAQCSAPRWRREPLVRPVYDVRLWGLGEVFTLGIFLCSGTVSGHFCAKKKSAYLEEVPLINC